MFRALIFITIGVSILCVWYLRATPASVSTTATEVSTQVIAPYITDYLSQQGSKIIQETVKSLLSASSTHELQ